MNGSLDEDEGTKPLHVGSRRRRRCYVTTVVETLFPPRTRGEVIH